MKAERGRLGALGSFSFFAFFAGFFAFLSAAFLAPFFGPLFFFSSTSSTSDAEDAVRIC
jgi:hypothetical protein